MKNKQYQGYSKWDAINQLTDMVEHQQKHIKTLEVDCNQLLNEVKHLTFKLEALEEYFNIEFESKAECQLNIKYKKKSKKQGRTKKNK